MTDNNSSSTRFQRRRTPSFWFGRLSRGMANRIGTAIRKNVAMNTETYVKFLKRIQLRILASTNDKDTARWIIGGFYFCVYSRFLSNRLAEIRGRDPFLITLDHNLGLHPGFEEYCSNCFWYRTTHQNPESRLRLKITRKKPHKRILS